MDFIIAGLASVCAGFFTNPLEVLKVRMQLQGELIKEGQYKVYYRNIFDAAYVIARKEGVLALQKGLVPALWCQFIMNGLRLGTYQTGHSKGYITDAHGNIIFYKSVLLSGFSGIIGQFWASPLYMVKTHLQTKAAKDIAVGYQHHHKGTWWALQTIFKNYGVKGLFRGIGAVIPRAFIGSTSQLTSFTYVKEMLTKNNIFPKSPYLKSLLASMVGGVAITLIVSPFDLVLIRLYNQGVDAQGRGLYYKNYIDCVTKIYEAEGLVGFYKGLVPIYIRLGTHTVLCLVCWDIFKDLYIRYSYSQRTYDLGNDKK